MKTDQIRDALGRCDTKETLRWLDLCHSLATNLATLEARVERVEAVPKADAPKAKATPKPELTHVLYKCKACRSEIPCWNIEWNGFAPPSQCQRFPARTPDWRFVRHVPDPALGAESEASE